MIYVIEVTLQQAPMHASSLCRGSCLQRASSTYQNCQLPTARSVRGMPHRISQTQWNLMAKAGAASRAPDSVNSSQNEQANVSRCSSQRIASIHPAPIVKNGLANTVFSAVTVLMILVYTLMLFAARLQMTRRIINSPLLLGALASTFALCTVAACRDGLLSALPSIIYKWCSSPSWVPDFALLAPLFNSPCITLMVWVHLLMLDFFVARAVFTDATIHSIPAAHSLVLCFFVGPIGLLCHAVTRALVIYLRQR
ncbi:hypothetical protein DUNSADRAFT_3400 [Dunaliella salina]|uniref:Uncharacterized protein n=1 Tax=Dunaliella salina TaxID=3046 RepID=A0ABQ7GTZ5_DUNSA|nr:hypothetical protein DUNSADRAFT_3400 [Dunaliella salina]|eukprot:KAF5838091.1 hypothetical protein DUNSADRAFT_3400 [Dunaliella salina]